jgi:hypothetical protein
MAALAAILLLNLILPGTASAWKVTTHVYLTDVVLADALDNGKVTIYRVNYQTGEIIGTIGEYAVAPDILSALQTNAAQYRAGTVGPDGYPDLATGQQAIHPDPASTGIEKGTDAWLRHLWEQSNSPAYKDNPAVRAMTVGFLTHAAGDMYAHTFINNFTGGAFVFDPVENALKHVLLEGYIDKRLPKDALGAAFFAPNNLNILGVEDSNNDFIYRSMIDARPGTFLDTTLLPEGSPGTAYSVPRIYSTLRASLEADIASSNCQIWELKCIATREYKIAWRNDIDEGLRAWPQTSHQLMLHLAFNSERRVQAAEAGDVAQTYVLEHLLSMSGAPDFVGLTILEVQEIIDLVTPHELIEAIDELKANLLDTLLLHTIGMTKEQLREFVENPDLWFDVAMDSGPGEHVTLDRFNKEYLRITDTGYSNPDEAFDYKVFTTAHNSVTMSKLTLLSQGEVNRLLSDLGSAVRLNEPNIMLGFIKTLDGDNQWTNGMVLAQDRQVYEQIFMRQAGERPIIVAQQSLQTAVFHAYLPILASPEGCFGQTPTIIGTDKSETITGTPGDDVILGQGGDDMITGGGGNDFICGGAGNDVIDGNQGRDFVDGNAGNDTLRGGDGNDVLQGAAGNDTIAGGPGNDKIYGALGDDLLDGGEGHNLIFAGDGFDSCVPNIGNFDCEN